MWQVFVSCCKLTNLGYAPTSRSAISNRKPAPVWILCRAGQKPGKQLEEFQFIIACLGKTDSQGETDCEDCSLVTPQAPWLRRNIQLRMHDEGCYHTATKNNDEVKMCSNDLVSKAAFYDSFFFFTTNIQSRHPVSWRTFLHFWRRYSIFNFVQLWFSKKRNWCSGLP